MNINKIISLEHLSSAIWNISKQWSSPEDWAHQEYLEKRLKDENKLIKIIYRLKEEIQKFENLANFHFENNMYKFKISVNIVTIYIELNIYQFVTIHSYSRY